MRWLLAIPLLTALAAEPSSPEAAPPLERWRFNARERTARGLAAWQQERPAEAVGALDSALRLRPDDPLASFNAGTARLAAGAPEAEPLLERAAEQAGEQLAPDAYYNLGNARLAGGNPRGAIDAYQHALRRRADFPAAKRNLELALRRLEQQQKEQQQRENQQQREQQQQPQNRPQDRPDGNPQQSPPSSGAPDDPADSSSPQPPEESRGAPPAPEEQGPQGSGSPDESQTPSGAQRPLPQFRDQQDMTAEQAAAILQAVENLERQQRREQHEQRARGKARVEKDW